VIGVLSALGVFLLIGAVVMTMVLEVRDADRAASPAGALLPASPSRAVLDIALVVLVIAFLAIAAFRIATLAA
jgi:hypothetical protein